MTPNVVLEAKMLFEQASCRNAMDALSDALACLVELPTMTVKLCSAKNSKYHIYHPFFAKVSCCHAEYLVKKSSGPGKFKKITERD